MSIAAGVTLMSYVLYSQEAAVFVRGRELARHAVRRVRPAPLPAARAHGRVRVSPVEMAWRSRAIQLCSLGWLIATLWSLGVF